MTAPNAERVVLLHGLMNWPIAMKRIERALKKAGFSVLNWGYPSRRGTIQAHAAALGRVIRETDGNAKTHLVGFSLGGLIARCYLSRGELPQPGRLVMIASPNLGSERADRLHPYRWFRLLYGDEATAQLRTANRAALEALGRPPVEFGVIAGGRGDERGFSRIFPGDNDGTVSVRSARLEGAKDFILLRHRHTALLFARDTAENVVSFLVTGRFRR